MQHQDDGPRGPVLHNLGPKRPPLIWRGRELGLIHGRLDPTSRHWITCLDGLPGSGITAMALAAGWMAVDESHALLFDLVVWVGLEAAAPTPSPTLAQASAGEPRSPQPTLDDFCDRVLRSLRRIPVLSPRLQPDLHTPGARALCQLLRECGRVLLIVDNFHLAACPAVDDFLHNDVPPSCKVIATRHGGEQIGYPIRVDPLEHDSMMQLAEREALDREIALDRAQLESLARSCHGSPRVADLILSAMREKGVTETLARLPLMQPAILDYIVGAPMREVYSLQRTAYKAVIDMAAIADICEGMSVMQLASHLRMEYDTCRHLMDVLHRWPLIHLNHGSITMPAVVRDYVEYLRSLA